MFLIIIYLCNETSYLIQNNLSKMCKRTGIIILILSYLLNVGRLGLFISILHETLKVQNKLNILNTTLK